MPVPTSLIRQPLLLKFIAILVSLEILVISGSLWSYQNQTKDFLEQELPARATPILALLNTALGPVLFAEDHAALAARVETVRRQIPMVRTLKVYDLDHQLIARAGPPSLEIPDHVLHAKNVLQDGIFHQVFALNFAGGSLGEVHLDLDVQPLLKLFEKQNRSILIANIGGSLLLLLALGLAAWAALRRLSRLERSAQNIAVGNFSEPLPVDASDEIGRLAATFEKMRQALGRRERQRDLAETRLRAIADYTYAWEIWIDNHNRLVWTNPSCERLTGYTAEELYRMPDFPGPMSCEDGQGQATIWQKILDNPRGDDVECQIRCKAGYRLWVSLYWQPIADHLGEPLGTRISAIDVTERRETRQFLERSYEELRLSEGRQKELLQSSLAQQARFQALLSTMKVGILFETPERKVEYLNPVFKELLGFDQEHKLPPSPTQEIREAALKQIKRQAGSSSMLLASEAQENREQVELQLANGRILSQSCHPVHDGYDRFVGHLWLFEDITSERQTAEQLIFLAERDSLTGLYNRHRFEQEMERMVNIVQRHGNRFALLYFDLDGFKAINDNFGHLEGDQVLIRVSAELTKVLRKDDIFARLGGDEFAVLSQIDNDLQEARTLAHRMVTAVSTIPLRFQGQNTRVTSSVGISVYPDLAATPDDLMTQADAAMYQAKSQGKNTWSVYDPKRTEYHAPITQLTWLQAIDHALEQDSFVIHYQGIYRVADRELVHLEALVRLPDPVEPGKLYLPGQFIPLAEKTGKVLAIDQWVLRHVIAKLGKHPHMPPVAVNISGRSFDDPSLPHRIREWLARHKVQPHRLMIELTETAAVSDIQDAQHFIEALHRTGCPVCLDDFGSGFSSFAYLKHIEADILKIDGQFIHDLPDNLQNQLFLRAITDVARGLHKQTVAEFVENQAIFGMLQEFGIELAQGNFLDLPQAAHPAIFNTSRGS